MFGFKNPGAANILAGISAAAGDLAHPGQNRLAGVIQSIEAKKEADKKKALVEGLLARLQGESTPGAPGSGGIGSLAGNELGALAVLGVPGIKELIDIRGQEKPTYEEGVRIANPYAPTNPGFIPKRVEGMAPSFGPGGQLSMGNIPGAVPSMAEMEMAKANAIEAAKSLYVGPNAFNQSRGAAQGSAPYQDVRVEGPRGEPITMSRERFAGSGPFVGQAPAAAAASEDAAKRQVELDFTRPKAQGALTAKDAKTEIVRGAIARAKQKVSGASAGMGALTARIPGSPARNLQAELETIKANLGFEELQTMRDNSPTGGALGQVAVQELEALRSTIASLDQAQSPEQLAAALDRVDQILQAGAQRRRDAFTQTYDQPAGRGARSPAARPDRSAVEAELRRRKLIP